MTEAMADVAVAYLWASRTSNERVYGEAEARQEDSVGLTEAQHRVVELAKQGDLFMSINRRAWSRDGGTVRTDVVERLIALNVLQLAPLRGSLMQSRVIPVPKELR